MSPLQHLRRAAFEIHRTRVYEPRVRRIVEGVAREIGRASSLLDVGAGDGTTAALVARVVGARRVEGVDVKSWGTAAIPIKLFDGQRLPFKDGEFDAVTICDVLHHASEPKQLLRECARVARQCVVVKDHISFGPISDRWLLAMDMAGNARVDVAVRGTYFTFSQWIEMVEAAGARFSKLQWPFTVHGFPWSILAPSQLQFVARIEPLKG